MQPDSNTLVRSCRVHSMLPQVYCHFFEMCCLVLGPSKHEDLIHSSSVICQALVAVWCLSRQPTQSNTLPVHGAAHMSGCCYRSYASLNHVCRYGSFCLFWTPLIDPRSRLNTTLLDLAHIGMSQTGFMHRLSDRTKGQFS